MSSFEFEFIIDLASEIRKAILPHTGSLSSREAIKVGFSGDTTFGIDTIAETALLKDVEASPHKLAFFSEDQGLVKVDANPDWLLIVDPIDGTRPLMCGFEMAVVSIALCRFNEEAAFGDILAGVVLEIKTGNLYYAEKGRGVKIDSSLGLQVNPSATNDISRMFWTYECVGYPLDLLNTYLNDLIEMCGMQAAVFLFNSSAYSMAKIVTGQLDAHLELGGRILRDFPEREADFVRIGNGQVFGTNPYDIVAAYIIMQEANCIITDAYGGSLQQTLLLNHGKEAVLSFVAAANSELHKNILNSFTGLN